MLKLVRDKFLVKVVACFVVFAFAGSGFAAGLQSSRIIPTSKVILYKGDQKAGEFSAEAPFPEGYMLKCEGRCAAKLNNLYVVAEDKSLFSIKSAQESRELGLKEGTLYFALRNLPKVLVFATPERTFTAEQIVVNASTDGLIKGYVSVTPEKAEIGVLEGGSMLISTSEGKKMVKSGQKIMVAAASGAASSDAKPEKAAAAEGASSTGGSNALLIGGIAAGVVAAGAAVLAGSSGGGGGDDDNEASPYN